MVELISYFFSLAILFFYLSYYSISSNYFGTSRRLYHLNPSWLLILILYATYMFGYREYNAILESFCIVSCLFIVVSAKNNIPLNNSFLKWYCIFIVWCTITILYTTDYAQWVRMMVKLVLPYFFYAISYNAFTTKENIWLFIEKMAYTPVLFFLLTVVSLPFTDILPIYQYFGMAVIVFPLIMYWRTKQPKYLFFCLLCLSGNIISIKRTPILGMVVMFLVYFCFKYRLKALIPCTAAICLAILSVVYIPAVRERMFFEGADLASIDLSMLYSDDVFTLINSNGRSGMWDIVTNKFYKGNELLGVGLGSVKSFLLSRDNDTGHFLRLHNDWLHLLCEVGWIGVSFLLLFFMSLIKKTYRTYKTAQSIDTKLIALACPMASVGTMLHMLFENCIGVFGYYIPFIFSAIYFKYLSIEKNRIQ